MSDKDDLIERLIEEAFSVLQHENDHGPIDELGHDNISYQSGQLRKKFQVALRGWKWGKS